MYQQRLSVIWSSPLSDYNKVLATNLFVVLVLTYVMWTQVWPIAELQRLDRASREAMIENGAKHPLGSTKLIYLPRCIGGRGLKSIEQEYKLITIKAAVNLYRNQDLTMGLVREFEEKVAKLGRRTIIKDAENYFKD